MQIDSTSNWFTISNKIVNLLLDMQTFLFNLLILKNKFGNFYVPHLYQLIICLIWVFVDWSFNVIISYHKYILKTNHVTIIYWRINYYHLCAQFTHMIDIWCKKLTTYCHKCVIKQNYVSCTCVYIHLVE